MPNPITDPRNPGKPATEARQGQTLGTMRYVLAVSVILAIVAMIAVYLWR